MTDHHETLQQRIQNIIAMFAEYERMQKSLDDLCGTFGAGEWSDEQQSEYDTAMTAKREQWKKR